MKRALIFAALVAMLSGCAVARAIPVSLGLLPRARPSFPVPPRTGAVARVPPTTANKGAWFWSANRSIRTRISYSDFFLRTHLDREDVPLVIATLDFERFRGDKQTSQGKMSVSFTCKDRPATYTRSYLGAWSLAPGSLRTLPVDREEARLPMKKGSAMEGIWLEACEKPEQ